MVLIYYDDFDQLQQKFRIVVISPMIVRQNIITFCCSEFYRTTKAYHTAINWQVRLLLDGETDMPVLK